MILFLLACSGKDDSSANDDSSAGTGRRFAGTIVDRSTGDPIPDADVCIYPENVCEQTSAGGSYTIFSQRPDDTEFLLLVAEPGWVKLTVPFTVPKGDGPEGTFEMWGEDLVPDSAKSATLLLTTMDGSGLFRANVTVSVEDTTDATTDSSGEALFVGLAENNSATITTDAACTGTYAWEGLKDGTFRAKLEAGTFFSTRVQCE